MHNGGNRYTIMCIIATDLPIKSLFWRGQIQQDELDEELMDVNDEGFQEKLKSV